MAISASVSSTNSIRRKLALVIGISDYSKGKNVVNAINDAKEMSYALKCIGFIIHGNGPQLNLTSKEMSKALRTFKCCIEAGDMVLFYFAGHGKQWEDQNYLIPSDNYKDDGITKIDLSGSDLSNHSINAQQFLNDITIQNPFVTIFFLDCCRTYHLRSEHLIYCDEHEQVYHSRNFRSLSGNDGTVTSNVGTMVTNVQPTIASAGLVIAFACAPGTVADDGKKGETHGLFTKHILKHIQTPNEDIRMILTDVTNGVVEESESTQIPFVTCSLRHRNICLYEQNPISPRTPATTKAPSREQRYDRSFNHNTLPPPSSMNRQEIFGTIMKMMMSPTQSTDGRLMDEDGYYNEDGSRSFV